MKINIETAMRHARRLESAKEILNEGYTFPVDVELENIYVCKPGRLAASYIIHRGQCDCPDFIKHGDLCKHTLAAKILADEDVEADRRAAEDAEERFWSPFVHASH